MSSHLLSPPAEVHQVDAILTSKQFWKTLSTVLDTPLTPHHVRPSVESIRPNIPFLEPVIWPLFSTYNV